MIRKKDLHRAFAVAKGALLFPNYAKTRAFEIKTDVLSHCIVDCAFQRH
jgi:hypothetical protein